MKLVIVESPTKQRTIYRYLGSDFKTSASFGHIRDLAISGEDNLGIDIDNNFEPEYEVIPRKANLVKRLEKMVEEADEVYLATDPDREGEAIAFHLASVLNLDLKKVKRLDFFEITPYGVKNALENPRLLDLNLVESQETRRILDRIIGFKLSNLLRKKIKSSSAGRVQSAVLKLIVEREKEIENFVVETYYLVVAKFHEDGKEFTAYLVNKDNENIKLSSKEEVDSLLKNLNKEFIVESIEEEVKEYYPRPPFTTSSLQQDAFSLLKFSPKKTMQVAQSLYEGVDLEIGHQGIITYMRTDSIRLTPVFINKMKQEITNDFGEEYVGTAYAQKSKGGIQDAHEAIRPTNTELKPKDLKECLTSDQYKLYELIYYRTMASMMKPRVESLSKVKIVNNEHAFLAEGNVITFEGFSKAYKKYAKPSEVKLPKLEKENKLNAKEVISEDRETKPPYRYSEGSIVNTMERLGIGRPSTYVMTLDTLKKRDYVKVSRGYLSPTKQGILTSDSLSKYFETLVDAKYTANLELDLDKIENGKITKVDILEDFYKDFQEKIVYADKHMEEADLFTLEEKCPVCGKPLIKRKSKYGKDFIGCSGYPNCTYIKQEEIKVPKNAKTCPKCNEGKLVVRTSRYGNFLSCNRYPDCDYTEKFKKYSSKKKDG